jgi:hypothetical protein
MQPFDHGVFDERYEDVYAPAITDAGLAPYRVDQDPKVSIPIEDIEAGIRNARLCLADITIDNPNVWFELGYAIACRKEVVLVCSKDRTSRFPFDIQHRSIITYATGSIRDFAKLQSEITERLKAYAVKAEKLATVAQISRTAKIEGLEQHEIVCLAALAENLQHPRDHASAYQIKRDMEASGFTKVATTIAIAQLLKKEFLEQSDFQDDEGNYFTGYVVTDAGWRWILENQQQFVLRKPAKKDDSLPF